MCKPISSQSLNLEGRRSTTDDVATIHFHSSLSSAALRESPNPILVHSLMLLLISNQRAKADNAAMSYENQYCSDTASLLDFTGIEATAHLYWFKGPTPVINNDHTRVICSELYS